MISYRPIIPFLGLIAWWCLAIGIPFIEMDPHRFLFGDPLMQYYAVESLVTDGDLDVRNQLNFEPEQTGGQTALGVRGEWYPVHETLLIFLAAPFFLIAGPAGLWLMNIGMSLGIAYILRQIALRFVADPLASVIAILIFATTPLLTYSYSFSVDTLSALGVGATYILLLSGYRGWAGFAAGLAVWGRFSCISILPACLIYTYFCSTPGGQKGGSSALKFILGGVPCAIILGILNYSMFGGVFETGYHHNQHLRDGTLVLISQSNWWSVGLLDGITTILLDRSNGLLFSWPLLLPAFALGFSDFLRQRKIDCILACSLIGSLILFYAPYAGAVHHGGGVRHFMPVYVLLAGFVICALQRIIGSHQTK